KETNKKEIVVGTEEGMIYRLQKENPDKKFYPLKDKLICQGMKAITLDNLLKSLKELKYEIKLPEEIIKNAYKPIQRMVEL
ncbi:quinolinate synthase, partial [candidate division TA06 bacterium]